jgi:hypothetical protein
MRKSSDLLNSGLGETSLRGLGLPFSDECMPRCCRGWCMYPSTRVQIDEAVDELCGMCNSRMYK